MLCTFQLSFHSFDTPIPVSLFLIPSVLKTTLPALQVQPPFRVLPSTRAISRLLPPLLAAAVNDEAPVRHDAVIQPRAECDDSGSPLMPSAADGALACQRPNAVRQPATQNSA